MGPILSALGTNRKEKIMIKKALSVALVAALCVATAVGTHIWTMCNMRIETNGDGDSAIIEVAGQYWFYGINGHEPSGEFYAEYDGEGYMGE